MERADPGFPERPREPPPRAPARRSVTLGA